MNINPTLLTLWAVLAACFLALLVYRGQLTRYEEDRLFLGKDAESQEKVQRNLARKLHRLEPAVRVFGGAAALMTVSMVGLYMWHAWQIIH